MFLTKSDFADKTWPDQVVALPEFGGKQVRVKTLTAGEFLRLADLEKRHQGKSYALWFITAVVDEAGEPLFGEDDIEAVDRLPFSVINRVVDAARAINFVPAEEAEVN